MARIDKYDPLSGGHRAPLAAAVNAHDGVIGGATAPVGVGLDSSGRVVVGVGVAAVGIIGVLCLPRNMKAGDIVDVMTAGEIVDVGGAAGTAYTANTTTGAITSAAASATQIRVGYTVEVGRLVVRI